MTTPKDVGWGKYRDREGPYFTGTTKFALPADASDDYRLLAVITSTEGGSYDAINAYDRCVISVGLLQWCEAKYFLTSKLLGAIAARNRSLLDPLKPALEASGAEFKDKGGGRWRFFFKDGRGEVDAGTEQKQLFLLNSSGFTGSWDDASRDHAKLWAACMANVLAQPEARDVQAEYTASRIRSFATADARKVLFDGRPDSGWVGAARAIFLSFAANLPAVAAKQLRTMALCSASKWSPSWCTFMARQLTFGPGISIYPHRYNSIRPVVERMYGVDLPDMAAELKEWKASQGLSDIDDDEVMNERPSGEPTFTTVREVQQLLSDMGYDLGPAGVDGKMGNKTREAVITFQGNVGLDRDGIVGPKTRAKMLSVWRSRTCV